MTSASWSATVTTATNSKKPPVSEIETSHPMTHETITPNRNTPKLIKTTEAPALIKGRELSNFSVMHLRKKNLTSLYLTHHSHVTYLQVINVAILKMEAFLTLIMTSSVMNLESIHSHSALVSTGLVTWLKSRVEMLMVESDLSLAHYVS